jgi:hypothetical protein
MNITGKSNENYNFNGVSIESDITKATFFNKPALIVICHFDSKFPVDSLNYTLTLFGLVTEENLATVVQDVVYRYNTEFNTKYPGRKPNYIGYYLDGDLEKIYNDIIEGKEYKSSFKIQS